jgi:cobalt-zinc-cadmium efflux system outer membrane protein
LVCLLCVLPFAARPSLGSSAPADRPLTLEGAVAAAVRQSPAVQRARFEREANRAAAQRDAPRFAPAVSLTTAGILNEPRITFPRGTDGEATVVPRTRARMELTAETPLFHAGAAGAARQARASISAAELGYEQALADVRRDVKKAYFALLASDAGVAVAQEGVEQARAHRRLVDDLVQAGRATRLDQLQGDVEVEQAVTAAADAADARELAAAALSRYLGEGIREGTPERQLVVAPVGEPGPPPEEASALALIERRPDARALAAQVEAAEAGARLARLQNSPSLNLAVGYALQTPSAFVARSSWNTALSLVIPIGAGARARFDAREAAARAASARVGLEELRQGAALEVRQALMAIRSARRRRESAARAVTAAEEALRITELRFEAGRATGLEVAAARAALNRSRLDALRALYDWHSGLADLERATGEPVTEESQVPPGGSAIPPNGGAQR